MAETRPRRTTRSLVTSHAVLVILIALAAAACGDAGATRPVEPVVRDSAGVTILEYPEGVWDGAPPIPLAEAPTVRIGTLDGADELQLTQVGDAVRMEDGSFAILERRAREVRVFGSDGAFRHRFGREGEGPGEFRSATSLHLVPGDTLAVWDSGAGRLTWFGPDGVHLRDRALAPFAGGARITSVPRVWPEILAIRGSGMTPNVESGRYRDPLEVIRIPDRTSDEAKAVAAFPGTERELRVASSGGEIVSIEIIGLWHYAQAHVVVAGPGIWETDGMTWHVRRWATDGSGVDRLLRVHEPPRRFTQALIDEVHAAELEGQDPETRERIRARHGNAEYPEFVPPIMDLFVDAEERLWIGLGEVPPVSLPSGMGRELRRWLVFDADGTLAGRVELPPRSRPLHADLEGVLLVRVDELDIPYVEWFPYGAPRG